MSAVMPQADPTAGMRLVSTRAANLEATRYLFNPGNFLDPERMFQVEHLRDSGGGEEVQAHCLRRTVGGFLPRARLIPLEVWVEPMPAVLLGEGVERDTVQIVSGPATAQGMGMSQKQGFLVGSALSHVKFYPGDEIKTILRANDGKGIVEAKALEGMPWYEDAKETRPGAAQLLNRSFFPTTPSPTLRGLREMIDKGASLSDIHRAVAADMLAGCAQFGRWAEARVAAEHVLLRQRVAHQHTYTYSPLARVLLQQLEMKPQDSILEGMSSGVSAEQIAQIVAQVGGAQQGLSPEALAQIAGAVTTAILAAQQQAAPQPDYAPAGGLADSYAADGGTPAAEIEQGEARTKGKKGKPAEGQE